MKISVDGSLTTGAGVTYPIVRGVPGFSAEGSAVGIHNEDYLSNEIN